MSDMNTSETSMSNSLRNNLSGIQRTALLVGIIGLVVSLILAFTGAKGFFQSYLYAYFFWLGLSLGCLVLLMVNHLAGGPWGAMISKPLEAGVSLLPMLAILFIPVLIGMTSLYEWTDRDFMLSTVMLTNKMGWLNIPFFIFRALLYFGIWLFIAYLYQRMSKTQDEGNAPEMHRRLRNLSGPGIIIYVLTMTFAAFDWGMSLMPEWFSGMYGVIFMIGQAISAMAFIILIMVYLAQHNERINGLLTSTRLQDLGNFLLGFTVFWTYVSFSQLIIIWSGNTVETNPFYVLRFNDVWAGTATFLLLFHFAMPFLILLSRWVKQKRRALIWVAFWMLFVRLVEIFWQIIPAYHREGFQLRFTDITVLVGLGGIWLAAYIWRLKSQPLVPLHDPRLAGVHHE